MSRYPANFHKGVMPSSYGQPIFLEVPKPFTAGPPLLGELEIWDTFHPCPDQRVPRAPSPNADRLNPKKLHIRVSYLCGRYFMTTAIHFAFLDVHLSQLLGLFVGHLPLLLVEDHGINARHKFSKQRNPHADYLFTIWHLLQLDHSKGHNKKIV